MKAVRSAVALSVSLLCFCCSSSSSSSSGSSGTSSGSSGGTSGDGGGATSNGACTGTSTGGWSGTLPCAVGASHSAAGNSTLVNISSPDQSDGVSILIEYKGAAATGTYAAATVINSLGDYKSTDKASEWEQSSKSGSDTEGTFTLTITSVGPSTPFANGDLGYGEMHGNFAGTFIAKSGGAGTSTLSITF